MSGWCQCTVRAGDCARVEGGAGGASSLRGAGWRALAPATPWRGGCSGLGVSEARARANLPPLPPCSKGQVLAICSVWLVGLHMEGQGMRVLPAQLHRHYACGLVPAAPALNKEQNFACCQAARIKDCLMNQSSHYCQAVVVAVMPKNQSIHTDA